MRALTLMMLFAFSGIAFADQGMGAEECKGPDTSTRFEACILIRESGALDAQLNNKYKELLRDASATSPSAKQALVESQHAWVRYRNKTCNFQQSFLGGINSINYVRCTRALTSERLKYFEGL